MQIIPDNQATYMNSSFYNRDVFLENYLLKETLLGNKWIFHYFKGSNCMPPPKSRTV